MKIYLPDNAINRIRQRIANKPLIYRIKLYLKVKFYILKTYFK